MNTKKFNKNFFKSVFFIFLFSFSFVFVSANQLVFESYLETADIKSENNVHETIEVIINIDEAQDFINFSAVPGILNLQVFLDDDPINCNIRTKVGSSEISCSLEKNISGKHFFKIEFDSDYSLISLKENRLMFRSSYEPLIETKSFIYILKLPLGYVIPEEPGKDKSFFISPSSNILYSDGQRIILRWEKKPLNEKFEISAISESLKSKFNFWIVILIFVLVITLLLLFFYLKKKIKQNKIRIVKKKEKSKSEIIEEYLMESEKKIINELKNADKKELWQKQLQIKTGFSKSKLSRLMINLENRNLIQKIPFGNTNKIKLKIK